MKLGYSIANNSKASGRIEFTVAEFVSILFLNGSLTNSATNEGSSFLPLAESFFHESRFSRRQLAQLKRIFDFSTHCNGELEFAAMGKIGE